MNFLWTTEFYGLVSRDCLSGFHACNRFVQRHNFKAERLWQSCRDELRCFRGIMTFVVGAGAERYMRWTQQHRTRCHGKHGCLQLSAQCEAPRAKCDRCDLTALLPKAAGARSGQ